MSIAKEVAAALARAAIATAGKPLVAALTRPPQPPASPWDEAAGEQAQWQALVIKTQFRGAHIDGQMIRAGDLRVLMEATGQAPQPNDRMTIGATEYVVVAVEAIDPGGEPALYIVHCRR